MNPVQRLDETAFYAVDADHVKVIGGGMNKVENPTSGCQYAIHRGSG